MTVSNFFNRIIFNAASGGTADFVASSALTGFRLPFGNIPNGTVVSYTAQTSDKSQWETGQGIYNSGTNSVQRTSVRENSLGTTALINFTTAPIVRIDFHAQDFVPILQGLVTTQFDATNNNVLTDVPGLSLDLLAGRKYRGRVNLFTSVNATPGMKVGMGGTVGINGGNFFAHALPFIAGATISNGQVKQTTLGQITSGNSGFTVITIDFFIDVATAGTLTVTFSQGVSGGTTVSVLIGSNMMATVIG